MRRLLLVLMGCMVLLPFRAAAYSVLTHQALVDAAWDLSIMPLLKSRFPGQNDSTLRMAHSYAYGGAIAPDMGYYPFGSQLFTNLTHYVRSGDLVQTMLKEARNVNEYAFALGALCHYYADVYGHPIGTNRSVPLLFPKLRKKHGPVMTYQDDRIAHIRTEFSFDVVQTARGNYASKAYHDFIGFRVDTAILERAFFLTYGLHLTDLFRDLPRAVNTFRWSVAHFLPAITRTAWASKKRQIRESQPTATGRSFRFRMKKRNFQKEYGKEYERPGIGTTIFSFLLRIAPKVGPLRILKFPRPKPEAEKQFINSFDTTLIHYRKALALAGAEAPRLINRDYDTGGLTAPGEYALADQTYRDWIAKLQEGKFTTLSFSLRQHLKQYYSPVNQRGQTLSAQETELLKLLSPGGL